MAATSVIRSGTNGLSNGIKSSATSSRFADIPPAVDIPVRGGGEFGEAVEVNLEDELDDPTELCQLLENEEATKNLWITIALAYAKQGQIDHAQDILARGASSLARSGPKERLTLLTCMAWMDLWKSRQAPRVIPETQVGQDLKTKDHYLREATTHVNEALRINPAFPPLLLTRGVLSLLKASLTASTKTGGVADAERKELVTQALKCFEDALKASDGRNMMAAMGRARALYLQSNYRGALAAYQTVLSKMPSLTDPDPRIGIGCCYWKLNYHDNAKEAWERSLAVQPGSKVAHSLLGVYYLREAKKHPVDDPQFNALYTKAVKQHMQKAYEVDKKFAFNDVNFADYFLLTGRYPQLEALARTAIEQTDINAIASDGWYLIARKEHGLGDATKANDAYNKSDSARSVMGQGHWPAKFGMVQLVASAGNLAEAKTRLENFADASKSPDALTLLGCLYAEEVFAARRSAVKEDKSALQKKALSILENIRRSWKDPKSRKTPDESVLVYLAQLHEIDNPLESFKLLNELKSLQSADGDPAKVNGTTNGDKTGTKKSEETINRLPPQLLNNLACFLYGTEEYDRAAQFFQVALHAVVDLNGKQEADRQAVEDGTLAPEDVDVTDTDALVTSISYNLGRAYEAMDVLDEAKDVYEKILERHSDYTDASARLAVIALKQSPQEQGPRKIAAVYQNDYGDTEVRALMGWYYHSSKKKTSNLAEDTENRHYKHTLQGYDKHDIYSLVGMGNIHLLIARDMPKMNDAEKEKRGKMYQKAYEFFDKALQLDPKNAYAAQGIAIALCDDKKQYSEALQILVKVKETIKDSSIYVNLGHVYAELRQYQRSVENYETALRKDTKASNNAQLFACLARVLLLKGKADKSIYSLNQSLDYMKRALATQPESPHLQFNVAFIQFQIVQLVNSLPETSRTLEDVEAARKGLEEAISTFETVAKAKNPPYPRSALEQRAAMSKGTMSRQVDRSYQQQSEYERNNKEKIEQAKEKRLQELRRREETARAQREAEEEKAKKIAAEREEIIRKTDELAENMRAEALAREAAEYTDDEETGERVKRASKKKRGGPRGGKKRDREDDGFIEDDDEEGRSERSVSRTPLSGSDDEAGERSVGEKSREPKKKKRRLERKSGGAAATATARASKAEKPGKYKSAAVVVESDSEEEEPAIETPPETPPAGGLEDDDDDINMREQAPAEEVEEVVAKPRVQRQRKQLRTIADDDDDEDEEEDAGGRDNRSSAVTSQTRNSDRVIADDDEDE